MSLKKNRESLIKIAEGLQGKWIPNLNNSAWDGACGAIFEREFGVESNSSREPDFGIYELKALDEASLTALTLFTKEPRPRGYVSKTLVKKYGYQDEEPDRKAFRLTITREPNNRGLYYDVSDNKLCVRWNPTRASPEVSDWLKPIQEEHGELPPMEAHYELDTLFTAAQKKLKNLVIALYEQKIEGTKAFVRFNRISIHEDFNFDTFKESLITGRMKIDFRARTGKNHGTAFRVLRGDINSLWGKTTIIGETNHGQTNQE